MSADNERTDDWPGVDQGEHTGTSRVWHRTGLHQRGRGKGTCPPTTNERTTGRGWIKGNTRGPTPAWHRPGLYQRGGGKGTCPPATNEQKTQAVTIYRPGAQGRSIMGNNVRIRLLLPILTCYCLFLPIIDLPEKGSPAPGGRLGKSAAETTAATEVEEKNRVRAFRAGRRSRAKAEAMN